MKVILQDGTELVLLNALGVTADVQGETRDCLSFHFPASAGLEAINSAFSPENCESIRLVEDSGTEHVHTGYVLRTALTLTPAEDEDSEDRITVTMAQRTYAESQLLELQHLTVETASQIKALTTSNQFLEDCLVEMAAMVYA